MKPRFSNQRNHALTLVEVLVVVVVLIIAAAFLFPVIGTRNHRSPRIACVSNLKQIGLAYRLWSDDNNDKFPMEVSVTNGGTLGLANGRNAWINYFLMSKELSAPKILHCPSDTNSFAATNFSVGFNNQNISYFVGLDANLTDPQALLSGDDNFEISGVPVKSGLLELSSNTPIAWSAARHKLAGNILLADGSVQMLNNSILANWTHQTGLATNRLALP